MKKILVTGGTVFVSRYVAEYYVKKGYEVYVLNRNTREQPKGVTLIEADRHLLGEKLRMHHFDVVLDMTAYTAQDVQMLLTALGEYDQYILLSSSAVYPQNGVQPFTEEAPVGENQYWKEYGLGKIEAEKALQLKDPHAYILRPPYLYGPYNNLYREAFVFDCAMADRPFFLPAGGKMTLQFFYIDDLCRFMDILMERKPSQRIFNVGNPEVISVKEWVGQCYEVLGKTVTYREVSTKEEQRKYFSFYDYEYTLDVTKQLAWMPEVKPLAEGLQEAWSWYAEHSEMVRKKEYLKYIDENLRGE
ncbi:MAG: NAD-dependent epimerase/dehydratase family protein [Lachnospiraceae bacterium]|jgi:nucleoside-diphosphate-sugar epimerase|nr:NAD-dependent epimerase/dehydratase family protein [Lachnospiraceae bacterium]